jgi:hypothetical protein
VADTWTSEGRGPWGTRLVAYTWYASKDLVVLVLAIRDPRLRFD